MKEASDSMMERLAQEVAEIKAAQSKLDTIISDTSYPERLAVIERKMREIDTLKNILLDHSRDVLEDIKKEMEKKNIEMIDNMLKGNIDKRINEIKADSIGRIIEKSKPFRRLEKRINTLGAIASEREKIAEIALEGLKKRHANAISQLHKDINDIISEEINGIKTANNNEIKRIKEVMNKNFGVIKIAFEDMIKEIDAKIRHLNKFIEGVDETKADVVALSARINGLNKNIKEVAQSVQSMHKEMQLLEEKFNSGLKSLKTEIEQKIDNETAGLLTQIQDLDMRMRQLRKGE